MARKTARISAVEAREVSFDIPYEARPLLDQIVDRAVGLFGSRVDRLSLRMDIQACHANGCPLDFKRLAAADDFNLMHDVAGITRHMDRSTGFLTNCFRPRFAA